MTTTSPKIKLSRPPPHHFSWESPSTLGSDLRSSAFLTIWTPESIFPAKYSYRMQSSLNSTSTILIQILIT